MGEASQPRQRLLKALNHQEPDRIPFDLGSTQVTGIHISPYQEWRRALDLHPGHPELCDVIQQLALPEDDLLEVIGVDTRGLFPLNSHNWQVRPVEGPNAWTYHDEWGITHQRLKPDGLYYNIVQVPFPAGDWTDEDLSHHSWPNMADPQRIDGLRQRAEHYRIQGYAVVLKDPFAGIFEMAQRIVGMENLLIGMANGEKRIEALFDRLLALKLGFWEMALPELAGWVDVIAQFDDYGTQTSQLISPRMFRRMIKPRLQILFDRVRCLAPSARRFFHSCGNVRPLLPDFIEIGVEILNPVHIRASGMDLNELKREFGDMLTFWGGGVDTQQVLPYGTPQEVKEDVRRNLDALAPGGGFVFSTVHNIQADVPVENIMAMWEALQACGSY